MAARRFPSASSRELVSLFEMIRTLTPALLLAVENPVPRFEKALPSPGIPRDVLPAARRDTPPSFMIPASGTLTTVRTLKKETTGS